MQQTHISKKTALSSILRFCFIIALAVSSILIAGQVHSAQVTVAWDPETIPVAGYKVYYGTATKSYTSSADAGANTSLTLQGLTASTYYVAATAYDSNLSETDKSAELPIYSVNAAAGTGGAISPGGAFFVAQGASQTFSIAPNTNYQILDVKVDGQSVGAVSTYTITGMSAPHTISATFQANTASYNITATAGAGGSISPSGSVAVSSGASQAFSITASPGYHVADVKVDAVSVGAVSSYTFTGVAASHTIAASFALNTYTLTPSAQANGSISPASAVTVNYGGSQAFTITPNANYHVSDVKVDGVSVGAVGSYTFTGVAASHTIAASFALNTYTLTPSAQANGSISPASAVMVNYGGSQTFTITPNANYHVSDVKVDGVSVGAVTSFTFSNVSAGHTIAASFALNTYTLTPSAQANGSISPASAVTVNCGGSQTFTITPNANYKISDVQVDGVSVGAVGSYTFSGVAANHAITASFAANTYTITPTAQANGSISPASVVTVNPGASQTFTITPNANYRVSDVKVDGVSVGAVSSYTFSNVSASHAITASFASNTYTITPTAQANGSILPASAVTVNYGASQTFSITPSANYKISDVQVDGVSVGAVGSYTFTGVAANHTITASFAANTYTITPTAQANGAISPASAVTVNSGASQTFSITPSANYKISDVQVDGASVGATATYTFTNVAANHTITASFAALAQPPVADAGPDQIVAQYATVTLNGTNSSDRGDRIVSYLWKQTSGKTVSISNPYAAKTTFRAPSVTESGRALIFTLTVTDQGGLQSTDSCVVNVTSINQPPVADAGQDQTVSPWTIVTLDGSKSTDPEGSTLTYLWEQTAGPQAALSQTNVAKPTFVAPESATGNTALTFRLTVKDVYGLISRDNCVINVTTMSTVPSAIVGPGQTVTGGSLAVLDGSGLTDPGSTLASFLWHQTGGSPVTLSDPTAFMPTFTAPTSGADGNPLTFMLTVTDLDGLMSRATQTVTVKYALPDLVGRWTSFSYVNGAISGTLEVKNAGNLTANSGRYANVAFYLSSDGVSIGRALSTQNLVTLGAAQTQNMQFKYTGSSLKGKYIVAVIDPNKVISESDETNNVARALIP